MAKRESIWRAADGTEHRSKQSAAVADAEHAVESFVMGQEDVHGGMSSGQVLCVADELHALLSALIKARAALAKHEGKVG